MKIKNSCSIILFLALICSTLYLHAEEEDRDTGVRIPPGMELQKVDSVNVVVPKGGTAMHRVYQGGKWVMLEAPEEYAARKFEGAEERLKKIEEELKVQKDEIQRLKKIVEK